LDNEILYSNETKEQPFYRNEDGIIIQCEEFNAKDVLKTLEYYQQDLKISQEFIRLQSLFLEDAMNVPQDMKKQVQDAIDANKPLLVDKYGFSDMKDEELKKLFKNKDKALKEQEEDSEPEIDDVYGYIGELIYKGFLEKSKAEYNYTADDAEVGGAYDFEVDKFYIDTKTTAKSLGEGKAPFYIHKTQHKFLIDHPDADYQVVRLSLKDMGIHEKAKAVKKIGKKPREEADTKKACENLVEQYWCSHHPNSFLKTIHEYKIKLKQ
jgi:hypothetical protein